MHAMVADLFAIVKAPYANLSSEIFHQLGIDSAPSIYCGNLPSLDLVENVFVGCVLALSLEVTQNDGLIDL